VLGVDAAGIAELASLGIVTLLAAHQFMGMLNELSLWPWMTGRESVPVPAEEIIKETIRMFLQRYRRAQSKRHGQDSAD
jgi:AefR-like transcriptional repressor, C-terminal domain